MEGETSAAPCLARDFYTNDYWASDPLVKKEAQVHVNSADTNLQALVPIVAAFQQECYPVAVNVDLQLFNDDVASDPQPIGQAKSNDFADNEDLQDFSKAVNGDLLLATEQTPAHADINLQGASAITNKHAPTGGQTSKSEPHLPDEYRSNNQGGIAISDLNVHFLVAFCGMQICNQQDISLLQGGLHQFAVLESFEGHAALSQNLQAASSFITVPPAAHSQASPQAFTSTTMPAIPVLLPQPNNSRLRAQASPWKPGVPSLPSILVGDIPLSPMPPSLFVGNIPLMPISSSSKLSHPLLLPVRARQSLAAIHSMETLGFEQPMCCSYCGHWMHSIHCGPTSTTPLGFSRLRGKIGADQTQESSVAVHHGVDPARHSTRPRCKMKSELKGFRIHKATLDPR